PDDDLAPVPTARQPTPGSASITEPASANPPEPAGMPANATGPIAEAGDTLTRTAAAAGVADAGVVVAQAASETRTKGGAAVTEATAGPVLATFHPGTMPVASASAAAASPGATPPANRLLPSFAHRRARLGAPRFHWKTLAAISALALLLMLQLLLADRAQLATNARWRPLLSNVCGVLGCTLPPWREPMAFTVLAREVRPHPSTPGALRVTATFRNDARWPQPWPQLRLTLSDVNGNAVATRDFSARDYLGAPPTQVELGSGQSASIAMDIVEPASRSVAFDFELH
ncbi:MAG: DUF3426 domain-containing protein, partial [Luteimonas sp.]|nr:DUF3426 domain-containing protein [Luteimonas sp.]